MRTASSIRDNFHLHELPCRISGIRKGFSIFRLPQTQIPQHKCCLNKDEGIFLEDTNGRTYVVSAELLNNLLVLFSEKIHLVFINAEYSSGICELLKQNIDFSIGISEVISNKQLIDFSASFYEALAEKGDIRAAFEFAQACANSESSSGNYQLLTLKKQSEISKVFFR